jgi:hypothetical protein
MMTTPRVTEIPLTMAPIEPDPFIGSSSRAFVTQQRLVEREARQRRTDLVRRLMRTRAAHEPRISDGGGPERGDAGLERIVLAGGQGDRRAVVVEDGEAPARRAARGTPPLGRRVTIARC